MKQSGPAQAQPGAINRRGRRLAIALYAGAVFLYWMSLYLYMPTLPVYCESRVADLAVVGVILSQYGLWQAVIRLPLGIAADWLGWRKPFIVAGIALAGIGAWTMGSAAGAQGLLIGRAVTGLAAGTWVPLVVVFTSLFPPEEAVWATTLLTVSGTAGRVLATSVTGSLNGLGGYALAFYLAAGAALLAILAVLPARELRSARQSLSAAGVGRLIVRRDVLLPSVLAAVSQYANWAATFGFLPTLARRLGASDVLLSLMTSLNLGLLLAGNLLVAAILARIGAHRLIRLGFVLLGLGIGGTAVAPSLPLLILSQLVIGLAQGVSYPLLMGLSIQRVHEGERMTAMGLHQSVYAVGMFSGPALSGALAEVVGIRPMLAGTAVAALVVGLAITRRLGRLRAEWATGAWTTSGTPSAEPENASVRG
ncbi:MAG: MFS transporter [Anaerolineae bacterium]|nr:MFS transporter [Anaerolineae bacterium]